MAELSNDMVPFSSMYDDYALASEEQQRNLQQIGDVLQILADAIGVRMCKRAYQCGELHLGSTLWLLGRELGETMRLGPDLGRHLCLKSLRRKWKRVWKLLRRMPDAHALVNAGVNLDTLDPTVRHHVEMHKEAREVNMALKPRPGALPTPFDLPALVDRLLASPPADGVNPYIFVRNPGPEYPIDDGEWLMVARRLARPELPRE